MGNSKFFEQLRLLSNDLSLKSTLMLLIPMYIPWQNHARKPLQNVNFFRPVSFCRSIMSMIHWRYIWCRTMETSRRTNTGFLMRSKGYCSPEWKNTANSSSAMALTSCEVNTCSIRSMASRNLRCEVFANSPCQSHAHPVYRICIKDGSNIRQPRIGTARHD